MQPVYNFNKMNFKLFVASIAIQYKLKYITNILTINKISNYFYEHIIYIRVYISAIREKISFLINYFIVIYYYQPISIYFIIIYNYVEFVLLNITIKIVKNNIMMYLHI